MSDYINRQAAIDAFNRIKNTLKNPETAHYDTLMFYEIEDVLEDVEPADVVQVVHGHWEYIDDTYCGFKDTDVRCSVCKTTTNINRFRKTKWCPDCGAKMDGEE